jgi:tetratricopeptide (TPR) repeat protein
MMQIDRTIQKVVLDKVPDIVLNSGTIFVYESGKTALDFAHPQQKNTEYKYLKKKLGDTAPTTYSTWPYTGSELQPPRKESSSVIVSAGSGIVATTVNELFPPKIAASIVLNSFASSAIYDAIETGFRSVTGVPAIEKSPKQNISLLLRALGIGFIAAELVTMCPVASVTSNVLYSIAGSAFYDAVKAVTGLLKPRRKNELVLKDQIQSALKKSQLALDICRDKGDRRAESASLGMLGIVARYQNENEKAIEFYKQAFDISREIRDWQSGTTWLGNLGIAYKVIDKPELSIGYHSSALVMTQAIGHRDQEKKWFKSLGNTYEFFDQMERARECFQEIEMLNNQFTGLSESFKQSLNTKSEAFQKISSSSTPHKIIENQENVFLRHTEFSNRVQRNLAERKRITGELINTANNSTLVNYQSEHQGLKPRHEVINRPVDRSVLLEQYPHLNTKEFSLFDDSPAIKSNYTHKVGLFG